MSKEVEWTRIVIDEFVFLANLTPEEEAVLRSRCAGKSIVAQAMELHMSQSKVSAITARLKDKYDAVQPHSTHLPPRMKKSRNNPRLTRQ